jgi:hypothetical protein
VTAGEPELRTFFTSQLGAGETLLACAYGVERESGAKRLARLLGASTRSWIGGALEADSGWGFATTATRLLIVRVRRVHRLLRSPKLVFDRPQSFTAASELGATLESRNQEVVLRLTLDGRTRSLNFASVAGFPDNPRQARAIGDWLVDQAW